MILPFLSKERGQLTEPEEGTVVSEGDLPNASCGLQYTNPQNRKENFRQQCWARKRTHPDPASPLPLISCRCLPSLNQLEAR